MSIEMRPREPVLLAEDFAALVAWYRDTLGWDVIQLCEQNERYAILTTPSGIRLGVADAGQVGITPGDRSRNTFVLQIEVDDVAALFNHVKGHGGTIVFGPAHNQSDDFWYGAVADPEGNQIWVVDANCP